MAWKDDARRLVWGVALVGIAQVLGCGSGAASGSDNAGQAATASGAKQGETCGDGVFGTPSIHCADGLVCKYPKSTAPTGPTGSSSALAGKCALPDAQEGETCGNGVFGTPSITCAEGLVCQYPESTAPTGPSGSSSAIAGKCVRAAKEGETCGNGVFGTPSIACGDGLVCKYPKSTAPTGPSGSSSAVAGTCAKAATEGETCGDGTFGTPDISCADGLVCKFPDSTAPTGPEGSSSALAGKCQKSGS